MKTMRNGFLIAALLLTGAIVISEVHAQAQTTVVPEKVTVAFADPSRPGQVRVSLIGGGITIRGHAGRDVIIEARTRDRRRDSNDAAPGGMRRIQMAATGLSVEEENNVMSISASPQRTVDLDVQVPIRTSLRLRTINGGSIVVEGVEGEMDVNNTNGTVTLKDVAGPVVAHALNGSLVANVKRVDPQKPMAFTSMNGKVDVTLPPDIKANVRMRSDHGEIFSDFEITLRANAPEPVVDDNRSRGGRYRVRFDRSMYGSINGGGPEIELRTVNGTVHIRKGTR